jgi:hypothetical protein
MFPEQKECYRVPVNPVNTDLIGCGFRKSKCPPPTKKIWLFWLLLDLGSPYVSLRYGTAYHDILNGLSHEMDLAFDDMCG